MVKKDLQKGQALLIVVLVMVVSLTIGLSVAVRNITNLRSSSESENSERAFSAAEAGVEQSLISETSINTTALPNATSYQTSVSVASGPGLNLDDGLTVLKDEPVDLWLSDYATNPADIYLNPWSGDLDINWGVAGETCQTSESYNTQAALQIALISGTKATPKVQTFAFDPCAARRGTNNFSAPTTPGDTINGQAYAYKTTINVVSGLIARIIPLYASTLVGVKGSVDLPSQGTIVTATGTSDNTKRKIVTFRANPRLPVEIFPFVLFSPK